MKKRPEGRFSSLIIFSANYRAASNLAPISEQEEGQSCPEFPSCACSAGEDCRHEKSKATFSYLSHHLAAYAGTAAS